MAGKKTVHSLESKVVSTAVNGLAGVVTESSQQQPRLQYLLRLALTSTLYLFTGKLGLWVPFTSGNVSPVWPAAGIALAAVLLWGPRVWPGIALGAFLVNFWSPVPAWAAVGIAVGNTAGAILGGYLFRRITRMSLSFSNVMDVAALITAAVVSPIPSASVGSATLFLTHVQAWSSVGSAWRIWWLGDAMGMLIVTPLFLSCRNLVGFKATRLTELLALLVGSIATCAALFGHTALAARDDVLAFVVFPFVIWAAMRFRIAGVAIVTFLIAGIALWGTAAGYGSFVKHNPLHNAILLQVFIAVTSVTGLILAAVVTERLRTEERMSDQAELLDLANDAIFVRTLDDKITYWNQGAERLYGWKRDEVLGRLSHDFLKTESFRPFSEINAQLLRDGTWQGELTHSRRDGSRIAVTSRWSVWRDKRGRPLGFMELNTDITERKRSETNIRALSGQLLQLRDDERRHIARELHDSSGQIIVALIMNLAVIEAEAEHLSPKAVTACRDSAELLQHMSKDLRTMSHLLHPPLLGEVGLPSAIRLYVEGFAERSKIEVTLEQSPQFGRLSSVAETAIFRIVQECLTNIHRHSGSPTARIRIARDEVEVRVEVQDEGKGVPPDGTSPGLKAGVGIQGMRERVRLLGGRCEISSGKGGTLVVAILPLTNAAVFVPKDGLTS
jgi:PAS domain S-box-containing protein